MKIYVTGLCLLLSLNLMGDIPWAAKTNPILGPDDSANPAETSFTTALFGSSQASDGGYMVQLIYAGPDDVIDPPPASVPASFADGTGVQGDDVIMGTRWVGANRFFDIQGKFNSGVIVNNEPDGNYYIRAWGDVSQDQAKVQASDPNAPLPAPRTSGGTSFLWYGDSARIPYTENTGFPSITELDFTATGSFTVNQLITIKASLPEIVDLQIASPNLTLTWSSSPASVYDIEATRTLTNTASWVTIVQDISADLTNTTSFTVNNITDGDRYYRVIPSP